MDDADIDREIIEYRRALESLVDRLAEGDRLPYEEIRAEADALSDLRNIAPAKKHAKITYLMERYEALIGKLVH